MVYPDFGSGGLVVSMQYIRGIYMVTGHCLDGHRLYEQLSTKTRVIANLLGSSWGRNSGSVQISGFLVYGKFYVIDYP